jgi:hypothetical protein
MMRAVVKLWLPLVLLLVPFPCHAEAILGSTTITLQSGPHASSSCSSLGTSVAHRLQIPEGGVIFRFEIEITPFSSNLGPPCLISLDFPWEVNSPFNHFSAYLGHCPEAVTIGSMVTVTRGSWGFDHLLGLTSQSSRDQYVTSYVCYNSSGELIQFSENLELRAIGEAPVATECASWSAVRELYR